MSAGKWHFCKKYSFSFSLKYFCVKILSVSWPTYRCLPLAATFVPLLETEHSRGVTDGKSLAHSAGWEWIYLGFQSWCCTAPLCTKGSSPSPCFWETPQPDEGCSALPLAALHAEDVLSAFRSVRRLELTPLVFSCC